jgi:hypothetical protein
MYLIQYISIYLIVFLLINYVPTVSLSLVVSLDTSPCFRVNIIFEVFPPFCCLIPFNIEIEESFILADFRLYIIHTNALNSSYMDIRVCT